LIIFLTHHQEKQEQNVLFFNLENNHQSEQGPEKRTAILFISHPIPAEAPINIGPTFMDG
jgi:hypothetical protein